jgi:hypothetical protein
MTENEDFERLGAAHDPRRVYRVEETPPELAVILVAALDCLIDDLSVVIARESGQSSKHRPIK